MTPSSGTSLASSAAAPVASAVGPQLGYVWSAAEQTLRPILGIPGAAQIGQSVVPTGQYRNAAATGTVALLEDATGYAVMGLPGGTPQRLPIAGSPTASQLRLSPAGTSALIFTPGATSLTLVTSLSANPGAAINQAHSLASPGPVLDAAVSDQGSAAVLVSQAGGTALLLLTAQASTGTLLSLPPAGAVLSFLASTPSHPDDLLVADRAANSLSLIRTVSSAPAVSVLPTAALLRTPAGVSASANGHWALVSNGTAASVVRVDLSGQVPPQSIACTCQPNTAVALTDDGYFRITEPSANASAQQPLWIANAATTSRTLFIPALSAHAASPASSAAEARGGLHAAASVKLGGR